MERKSGLRPAVLSAILILVLCLPAPVFALSTVSLTPSGDGVFLVQGAEIESAAALEINVSYSSDSLANPRFTAGTLVAGAMTAVNTNTRGTVRMAAVTLSPVRGSGSIGTLTFDRIGAAPGTITAASVSLANSKGSPIPAQILVSNSPAAAAEPVASSPGQEDGAAGPSQTLAVNTNVVTMQTTGVVIVERTGGSNELATPREASPVMEENAPASEPDAAVSPMSEPELKETAAVRPFADRADNRSTAKQQGTTMSVNNGVLDRFRDYTGPRKAGHILALFENENMIGCRQEPPVALSDGKTSVKIIFVTTPGNKSFSDIAVMGARLLSLTRDPDNSNTWVAELLPAQGSYQAAIAFPRGGATTVVPLTIAPVLDRGHGLPDALIAANLDEYLARKTGDLNNDGMRNYIDDYIFVVNYIAGRQKSGPGRRPMTAAAVR